MRSPPIRVIANGTLPPQTTVLREQMLKLLDIPDRQPLTIIGQVSTLISYKGQMVLLEAAKRILDRHTECVFLLVGYERRDEGYKESLLKRATELGISERVRIVSYPGPIGDLWNIIDIHVHASLLDSLPNALLEAMSLGKPSVVTAIGGIPAVIKHGVNGLLVPPGDPEKLAQCLQMLLDNPHWKAAIGREAQSSYSRSFSPDSMTRSLECVREPGDWRDSRTAKALTSTDEHSRACYDLSENAPRRGSGGIIPRGNFRERFDRRGAR